MALIYCANCEGKASDQIDNCPHCGHPLTSKPVATATATTPTGKEAETILTACNPSMWRQSPVAFIVMIFLSLLIIGIPFFLYWWLLCKTMTLTVTNKKVTLRTGILAKITNEVQHKDVRNIIVVQGIFQRIMGVGGLNISSAGQSDIEISINGIVNPQGVADMIRRFQS